MTVADKRADMRVHEVEPYNAEPPASALAGHPVIAAALLIGQAVGFPAVAIWDTGNPPGLTGSSRHRARK